ncbi:MAG: nickel-dependent lactate racemase [Spirochaetales bacterium]|nr:nickel-dependent lactate racemase [Spirochaetales bacterium]
MSSTVLKYGYEGLELSLPDTANFAGILEPRHRPALSDPSAAIEKSLREPIASPALRELARGRRNAVVVISDITRPVPNTLILPPLLEALGDAGIDRKAITILIATGIHRPNEGEELVQLVGTDIARDYHIINHFSKDDTGMSYAGTIMGDTPVYVNKLYAEADLKILTGFIEPHMWAGYSGGRKSILPGISSVKTLEFMHGAEMVAHPDVVYGKLEGNPFHEAGLLIMERVGADFLVNVTLDTSKRVTGVYSGHPVQAHLRGARELEPYCTTYLDQPLDFVVTTNGGAPLDINLYQTSKGVAGAAPVLRKGGSMVVASRCPEGLGSPEFVAAMNEYTTPDDWIRRALAHEFFYIDQWCAQEFFKWMGDHPIHLYSEGVSPDLQRRYGFNPTNDIAGTVVEMLDRYGHNARWAIVPDGPYLILRLS